ncbi:ABC transporter family protein, partial [Vibrio parahaemolyticus V-223/04]
SLHKPLIT